MKFIRVALRISLSFFFVPQHNMSLKHTSGRNCYLVGPTEKIQSKLNIFVNGG